MLFSIYCNHHMIFVHFFNAVYHFNWFADVELSLYPCNKFHYIMVHDPFMITEFGLLI